MSESIICSTFDGIDVLDLTVRVHNALRRSKIQTVGELVELNEDELFAVRNLGEIGISQIRERLAKIRLLDAPPPMPVSAAGMDQTEQPQILIDLGPPMMPRHQVVHFQQAALTRQIDAMLLHEEVSIGGDTLRELVDASRHKFGLYEQLLKILQGPITVSQELECVLQSVSQRDLDILVRRSGSAPQTLESIASAIGVTRERVRQLEKRAYVRVRDAFKTVHPIRVCSAIHFGGDMHLSFDDWSQRLRRTGLLGDWTQNRFTSIDQVELLVTLIKNSEKVLHDYEIPESLQCMMKLRDKGLSRAPTLAHELLERFGGATERLVWKHLRYSGAVSLEWLVNRDAVEFNISELRLILECKEFFSMDENWHGSYRYVPHRLEKNSVLHKSLLKMFQYCGPLEIHDVYFGIEHTCSRTDFPIPSVEILEQALKLYGYETDDALWYWEGEANEDLSPGESIIWDCIYGQDGVAHHSQLMQAILDSGLSGASLGGTLSRSPLYDNFQKGLYKLRGSRPDMDAIERARSAAERIPVRLTVARDTFGNITVEASLGLLTIANGTLVSDRIPNLSGTWRCTWGNEDSTDVRVTHNEIRGIGRVLKYLECGVADRIALTFNVINRTVSILKLRDET